MVQFLFRVQRKTRRIVAEVPELRIIDDELWQAVRTRQSEIADKYVNVTEARDAVRIYHPIETDIR